VQATLALDTLAVLRRQPAEAVTRRHQRHRADELQGLLAHRLGGEEVVDVVDAVQQRLSGQPQLVVQLNEPLHLVRVRVRVRARVRARVRVRVRVRGWGWG